jgi:hypothetical protein
MFTLRSEINEGLPAFPKEEVADASTKAHGQEEPDIESHSNKHQQVGHTHLHHK